MPLPGAFSPTGVLYSHRAATSLNNAKLSIVSTISETSLNSEERSLPIEPASEIPPGEVGSSIAAQVAVIIQTNKVRMPTAAIVMQQADVMENQYQVPRYRSTCNYGFSDLRYEYMT